MNVETHFNKPRLPFLQILNMSFGFLGIQIGFALQNANVSRIFQTLGAKIDEIPILWIAAPLTGLVVQPIIGYLSDRTWCSLGRRRPYFLVGAILASLALFIMPHSPFLWVAAGMLWILDASVNISMEPFRALVADLLPSEQRTVGFAVQSFLIGTGAVLASCLPYILTNWLHVSNTAPEGKIPLSVIISFTFGGLVFFLAVLWTVLNTKEYPPENLEEFKKHQKNTLGFIEGLKELFFAVIEMPKTMWQLAIVQFFSWFALFSMWIYTTSGVAQYFYGTVDTKSEVYQNAADWVGVLFAIYNGVAAIMAFVLPTLAKHIGKKATHALCLTLGALGFSSFFYFDGAPNLVYAEIGIGIVWCSILAMPYAILADSLPQKRMGLYMGIFNFFIVIPQIFAALVLGKFIEYYFNNEAIYALWAAHLALLLAGLSILFVHDVSEKSETKATSHS